MTPQRRTAQKQAVYEALCALNHPSATEVYAYLQGKDPAASCGSAFPLLSGFTETAWIRPLPLLGVEAHYDFNTSPHAHPRCRICGRVWDIEGIPAPRSLPEGFSWEECELEVSGVCAACTAKR